MQDRIDDLTAKLAAEVAEKKLLLEKLADLENKNNHQVNPLGAKLLLSWSLSWLHSGGRRRTSSSAVLVLLCVEFVELLLLLHHGTQMMRGPCIK